MTPRPRHRQGGGVETIVSAMLAFMQARMTSWPLPGQSDFTARLSEAVTPYHVVRSFKARVSTELITMLCPCMAGGCDARPGNTLQASNSSLSAGGHCPACNPRSLMVASHPGPRLAPTYPAARPRASSPPCLSPRSLLPLTLPSTCGRATRLPTHRPWKKPSSRNQVKQHTDMKTHKNFVWCHW